MDMYRRDSRERGHRHRNYRDYDGRSDRYDRDNGNYYRDERYRDESRHYKRRHYSRSRSRSREHKHHRRHHEHSSRRHHDDDRYRSRTPEKEKIPEWDDKERHYRVQLGESLTPRYKVLSIMGEGTFGKVVECWDREQERRVAVKIVRAIEKYRDAAMIEMDVLETIKKHDPQQLHFCIQMISWFDYRDHVCMVFEKYGPSLFDFMKGNRYRPFFLKHIQDFAKQILMGVAFMHDLTLIHTDLKPENILLVHSDYTSVELDNRHYYKIPLSTSIKLIDFGSATFDSHHHTAIISTRHYRAPEVILGMGWTYPCDIWSIGCILIELYTGDATFQTHENHEHLALFEKTFGALPRELADKADSSARKYFDGGKLVYPGQKHGNTSISHVKAQLPLEEIIGAKDKNHELFLDLLRQLLEYVPEKRVTAREALKHPFFTADVTTKSESKEVVQANTSSTIVHEK